MLHGVLKTSAMARVWESGKKSLSLLLEMTFMKLGSLLTTLLDVGNTTIRNRASTITEQVQQRSTAILSVGAK